MSSRVLTQISLSHPRRRAQEQRATCLIAWKRYRLGACMRGASRTSSLFDAPPLLRAPQTRPPQRAEKNSRTVDSAIEREVAEGSWRT